MSRKYVRTIKSRSRDKYSVEHRPINVVSGSTANAGYYQSGQVVVPATTTQGMRKVKHLTVSMTAALETTTPFFWALVFVPQGYNANVLFSEAGSIYEPNQFVMACGLVDPDAGPIRIRSPIARNLNSGDSVQLILASFQPSMEYRGLVSYAITLQ